MTGMQHVPLGSESSFGYGFTPRIPSFLISYTDLPTFEPKLNPVSISHSGSIESLSESPSGTDSSSEIDKNSLAAFENPKLPAKSVIYPETEEELKEMLPYSDRHDLNNIFFYGALTPKAPSPDTPPKKNVRVEEWKCFLKERGYLASLDIEYFMKNMYLHLFFPGGGIVNFEMPRDDIHLYYDIFLNCKEKIELERAKAKAKSPPPFLPHI